MATAEVVTAHTDTGIRDVLDQMDENDVGSVIITDDDEPVGIVTDRMIAMGLRDVESIDDVTTADMMTEDLVTISEDETHFEALETMSTEGIRRLPVVDADGMLRGIITLDDMLVVTASELSNAADVIEQQTESH
ncbi:CBS domain-containing protein [Natronosalvus vescus]|uniref:CBS domain-containing protein n=1 Tax=Natronosalvus vescus TaxID=2953881 RepID=UPI002090CF4B|nr:CBS domain-containing protein [Natronosalvus vescus]